MKKFEISACRLPEPIPAFIPQPVVTLYRTILYRSPLGVYVWPGDRILRFLPEKELPEELRSKLTMILAHKSNELFASIGDEMVLTELTDGTYKVSYTAYNSTYPDSFKDIGWRVSKSFFCLILTTQCLASLRGETLYDDAGRESKTKSKEGSK